MLNCVLDLVVDIIQERCWQKLKYFVYTYKTKLRYLRVALTFDEQIKKNKNEKKKNPRPLSLVTVQFCVAYGAVVIYLAYFIMIICLHILVTGFMCL